jgi:MFS transporter, ACS family, D-galactonate transporter
LVVDTSIGYAFKKDRLVTVSLAVLCQSFQALTMGGIALFLPLIRQDLGLSSTQGGSLAAATTLLYALMQIPAGYLSDRFGAKRVYWIGVLGTTVFAFTFGLVANFWQAVAVQLLSGIFRSFVFAAGMSLLTGWFSPQRRATAMALWLVGGFLGTIVLDIVGPLLVAHFDWRFPFLSFAAVGILSSLILMRFGKEAPKSSGHQNFNILASLKFFRNKLMWSCGIVQFVRLAVMQGISFWLPTFLMEERGFSLGNVGILVAVQAILTAPSNLIGAAISDRLKNPPVIIGFSLLVLAVTTALFASVSSNILLIALICINSIFVQMYFGPLFAIPLETLGQQQAGISNGFGNLFANVGGLVSVYILGILRDSTHSLDSGFYLITGISIAGLFTTFWLARLRKKPGLLSDA